MPASEAGRRVGRRLATIGTRAVLRGVLFSLALVAIGCAGGSATTSPGGSAGQSVSGAIDVRVADFKITPAQLELHGSTLTLNVTNDGPTIHNVSVRDASGNVVLHTADLKPGESETVSGTLAPGNFITFCSLPGHESLGTKGALVVTQP